MLGRFRDDNYVATNSRLMTQTPKSKRRVKRATAGARLRPWPEVEAEVKQLATRLGIPETTPESLRAYLEARRQITAEFRQKIFRYPGAAQAINELQRHHLAGGEILELLALLAVEVQINWKPSKPLINLPGAISFPSAEGAWRAKQLSRTVRNWAREIRQYQHKSLPPEFVLGCCNWKTDSDRKVLSETIRALPGTLDSYADFLVLTTALLRPPRGRRGRPALDALTRNLVQAVLRTLEEAIGSTYGVLKPLAVLITAAYQTAGAPRRFSSKALNRLLSTNQT